MGVHNGQLSATGNDHHSPVQIESSESFRLLRVDTIHII